MIQMQAASRRQAAQQALRAEAAWIGANATHKDLGRYVAQLRGEDNVLPPEALAGALAAAGAGLPVVSWEDIIAKRRGA